MADTAPGSSGLFASLRELTDTFLAILQNRIELFALEARAEKERIGVILIGSVILLMMVFMSLLVVTALFLAAFWEQRVWVLLAFSVIYLGSSVLIVLMIQRRVKAPLFGETLDQLRRDRLWLMHRK